MLASAVLHVAHWASADTPRLMIFPAPMLDVWQRDAAETRAVFELATSMAGNASESRALAETSAWLRYAAQLDSADAPAGDPAWLHENLLNRPALGDEDEPLRRALGALISGRGAEKSAESMDEFLGNIDRLLERVLRELHSTVSAATPAGATVARRLGEWLAREQARTASTHEADVLVHLSRLLGGCDLPRHRHPYLSYLRVLLHEFLDSGVLDRLHQARLRAARRRQRRNVAMAMAGLVIAIPILSALANTVAMRLWPPPVEVTVDQLEGWVDEHSPVPRYRGSPIERLPQYTTGYRRHYAILVGINDYAPSRSGGGAGMVDLTYPTINVDHLAEVIDLLGFPPADAEFLQLTTVEDRSDYRHFQGG